MSLSISTQVKLLKRNNNHAQAAKLERENTWYQCGKLYYRMHEDVIYDGESFYTGKLRQCRKMSLKMSDFITEKMPKSSRPVFTPSKKRGCCGT